MAFNTPNNSATNAPAQGNFRKSDGFLNLFIGRPDGGKSKVAGVGLRMDNDMQRQIIELMESDPEAGAALIKEKLIIDYQPVSKESVPLFDLPPQAATA